MELWFDPEKNEYIIEDKGYTLRLKKDELKTVLRNPTGISFKAHSDGE